MDYALMKNIISKKSYLFLIFYAFLCRQFKEKQLKLDYLKIEDKISKMIISKAKKNNYLKIKITEISSFEVEDKFFEKKIQRVFKKRKN
jgi:deoxyribodipyrimidine photolyase-related protein